MVGALMLGWRGIGAEVPVSIDCGQRHLARHELGRALVQHTQADLSPLSHHRRHEGSTPLKEMRVDAMHHQFFFIEV